MEDLKKRIHEISVQAKDASRSLALITTEKKNICLQGMAKALQESEEEILEANEIDLEKGEAAGLSKPMLDRLKLTTSRINSMIRGINQVISLPDPVGVELKKTILPNNLKLRKVTSPIGVISIIYESRPNVTSDAAVLCFKSGNATILRGGKEAFYSNMAISKCMIRGAAAVCPEFNPYTIQFIPTVQREVIPILLSQVGLVDLCIPRGGESLLRAVAECSHIPVIKHYKGVCHIYLHEDADLDMAERIVINAKTQRPGVCNAVETLLIHEAIALKALLRIGETLIKKGVILRCDEESYNLLLKNLPTDLFENHVEHADESDWDKEYLDLILSVKLVKTLEEAVSHINHFGSGHSDCIITASTIASSYFQESVDSAVVYWNASTRFTDGGEFGMGAEIGISTDKIGARGPMGLMELTSYKWLVDGEGQIRE